MSERCIIVDLDSTLADLSHRLHFIRQTPPDWPSFFAACDKDMPCWWLIELLRHVAANMSIYILSGRPEDYRDKTEAWLALWQVPHTALILRPSGDHRPDTVVKKEMLDNLRGQGVDPLCSIDDRPSVVKMWRENGVPCLAMDDSEWLMPGHHKFGEFQGKHLLSLMVGPTGAGKSSWLAGTPVGGFCGIYMDEFNLHASHVLSSDRLRHDLLGDWKDQTQNKRVFEILHGLATSRLAAGLPVVIDATHLRRVDRIAAAALAPEGSLVRYFVCNRPLKDKLATARLPEGVVRKHDQMFDSQLQSIMSGDGLPNVLVVDLRQGSTYHA